MRLNKTGIHEALLNLILKCSVCAIDDDHEGELSSSWMPHITKLRDA